MKMNSSLSKPTFETNLEASLWKEFCLENSYTKQDPQTSHVLIQAEAVSENDIFLL